MGDYDTLRPFDPDEDLMEDEKKQHKKQLKHAEREAQKVLEEVRNDVLALEGRSTHQIEPSLDADAAAKVG